MPTNFDALLRYHTIDKCLQNRFRKWTWQDLAEKCTDALLEANSRPSKNTVSQRTIEEDIRIMRSDLLGYNAPIIRKNGEYYYDDKDFSIRNITLTTKDIENLSAAIRLFKTYKGLEFFKEVEGILNKLEKKVHLKTYQQVQETICFEHTPSSEGLEWINPLMNAIKEKQVINLKYRKFTSEYEKEYKFHPYLLKEYRNRWYLVGWYENEGYLKTFALDRLSGFDVISDEKYLEEFRPDPDTYFKHTIGITTTNAGPDGIVLKFTGSMIPYIKTQPLHHSQQVIEESNVSLTISLSLMINYELERIIMGFVDEVEILEPASLRDKIKSRIQKAAGKF
ncbi:helix-turn-helix transcriptional regulator [Desertivirga arenae]|uniref:helix-turn-helix transcriptional regulator n=1 Tax=Desertivirga arenae TaxID=2810309 RepID=UPI001A956413|nr:WYL domain-containing protein [Pedobacter sp. SYSU D00823]